MSCCDDAATYLIKALGGEEVTKRVIGGTKWWQVRGVKGCVSSGSSSMRKHLVNTTAECAGIVA